jgi:hypothetical protein
MPLVNPNAGRKYPTRRNLGLTSGKTTADLNQVKLRQVTETERKQWEADTRDKDLLHHSFWSLDELVEYPFKVCCPSAIEPFLFLLIKYHSSRRRVTMFGSEPLKKIGYTER